MDVDLRPVRKLRESAAARLALGPIMEAVCASPAELVASRIRRTLEYVPADHLMINPDCGLRHLAPEVARQKLRAMVAGAAQVRAELAGARGEAGLG